MATIERSCGNFVIHVKDIWITIEFADPNGDDVRFGMLMTEDLHDLRYLIDRVLAQTT